MLSLGAFAFAAPWVLAALAVLPIIWLLLRITPPAPRRIRFPAIRLLFRLREKEDTPARTPWWLLLLRLLVATLLIVGLAEPLLNPTGSFKGTGPIVLVVDNGWGSGPNWNARRSAVSDILEKAAREDRRVVILRTAPSDPKAEIRPTQILLAGDARSRFFAMQPEAWPSDHAAAAKALAQIRVDGTPNVIWLSDGLRQSGTGALTDAMGRLGPVTVFRDAPQNRPLLLHPARLSGDKIVFDIERTSGDRAAAYWLRAIAEDGRLVARRRVAFAAGDRTTTAQLQMPTELRNKVSRIEVEKHRGPGATLLLDERLRRRPVGIATLASITSAQPLLSEQYYLARALDPYTEVRSGPIADLLQRPLSVMFVTDRVVLSPVDRARLRKWIDEGGVLVRFAGPLMAEARDNLVPVKLRGGNRTFGGAMSWSKPATLAAFDDKSPFAGLTIPKDVTVKRQVLAEPRPDLARRTWARLSDGTPLVTADKRGRGMVVLIHTTANADWSNLALSGLFVEMLRRMVSLSRGVAAGEERQTNLAPHQVLDGLGRLVTPPDTVRAIDSASFDKTVVGPAHPPGLYGQAATRRALNLSNSVRKLEPLGTLPAGFRTNAYAEGSETPLKPWLITAALLLLLFDLVLSYFMRGLFSRRTAAAATILIAAFAGAAQPWGTARAQTSVDDQAAIRATKETVFAYVKTGNQEADRVSEAALIGLGRILNQRTSVEPAKPIGVDPNTQPLAFYPLLYWPVTPGQSAPNAQGVARLQTFIRTGGMIIFDIRGQSSPGGSFSPELRRLTQGLKIPALQRLPDNHVLTRSYYLLQRFPGRFTGNPVWVARSEQNAKDGVSPVIIGANDWGSAWAIDENGRPMFATVPGGHMQREFAYRAGVNMVMYALTGNYKADQVHIPTILRRLGQ